MKEARPTDRHDVDGHSAGTETAATNKKGEGLKPGEAAPAPTPAKK